MNLRSIKRNLAVALLAASVGPAGSAPIGRPHTIFEFIEALDRAEPIERQVLEGLTGRQLECSRGDRIDCDGHDIVFGAETIGKLDFRSSRRGSILVLTDFANTCLSNEKLSSRFGRGDLVQACTDGVLCFYRVTRRSWGRLSVGLAADLRSDCATSLVMDTFPR